MWKCVAGVWWRHFFFCILTVCGRRRRLASVRRRRCVPARAAADGRTGGLPAWMVGSRDVQTPGLCGTGEQEEAATAAGAAGLMCPGRQTDRRAGYVRKQTGRGDGDLCWTEQEEAPGCCSSRSGLLLWQILLDRHRYPCPRPACPSVCLSVCRDTSNSRQAEHQTRHRARGRLMYSVPPQRQRLLRVSIRLL